MTDSRQSTATLTVTRGPEVGMVFDMWAATVTIGRYGECDIQVRDTWVSRWHARVSWNGIEYIVEDLGSTNGTYVNGQRVGAPRALRSGDRLQLGEQVEFVFRLGASEPSDQIAVPSRVSASPARRVGLPTMMASKKRRRGRAVALAFLLLTAVVAWILVRPGVFTVQPIGALPEGVTFIYHSRNPDMPFFSSPDGLCLEMQGSVNLLCRGVALSAASDLTDRMLIKLPYMRWAYLLSTGGLEFDR